MSFIAAVRVRVEREGRRRGRGVQKKKKGVKGEIQTYITVRLCVLYSFFSLLSFSAKAQFFFLFLLLRLCAARSASPHLSLAHTRHSPRHIQDKTSLEKNTNKPKNKEDSTLVRPDATQRSRHARERRPDFPSGYVAN